MGSHALLGSSKAKQWLLCTPSVRLEQQVGAKDESSIYAQEGTATHALCEYKVKRYLHEQTEARPVSEFASEEMENCSDIYAEFIIETIEKIKQTCPNPLVLVEEKLDFSHSVPDGYGTGDCVIVTNKKLYVVDFKMGQGVFVHCEGNPQMRLYALGAYHMFQYLYPIETVSMTIVQPRLDNISTDECTIDELLDWGENYVRPRAQLAYNSEEKYSVSCVIPKSDKKTLTAIYKAIEAAKEEGKTKKWGGKIPTNLKTPLRDGDIERPDDPFYANSMFFNASSKDAPQIVDRHVQPVLDPMTVYSDCYCNVSVNAYPFSVSGNRGIAMGLGNVQFIKDGERLSGKSSATSDFEEIEDDEDVFGSIDEADIPDYLK